MRTVSSGPGGEGAIVQQDFLSHLGSTIRRRKVRVILMFATFLAAAFLGLRATPASHSASTRLILARSIAAPIDVITERQETDMSLRERDAFILRQEALLGSARFHAAVVAQQKISRPDMAPLTPEGRARFKFSAQLDAGSFTIVYRDANRGRAKAIADAAALALIQVNDELHAEEVRQLSEKLRRRLDALRASIESRGAKTAAFAKERGFSAVATFTEDAQARRLDALTRSALEEAPDDAVWLSGQLASEALASDLRAPGARDQAHVATLSWMLAQQKDEVQIFAALMRRYGRSFVADATAGALIVLDRAEVLPPSGVTGRRLQLVASIGALLAALIAVTLFDVSTTARRRAETEPRGAVEPVG